MSKAEDKEKQAKAIVKKVEKETEQLANLDSMLLKGGFPDVNKLNQKQLRDEIRFWRNVWNWVPPEVRYYVARTGATVGITMRNFKRYLGVLLDTHWSIDEIELGVDDKTYDTNTGKYYYERKIIKTRLSGLIDFQIIASRIEAPAEEQGELTQEQIDKQGLSGAEYPEEQKEQ